MFGVQILVGMEHEKKFLIAVLFGTVSNLCLNLWLISSYGSLGASIASVIAEILVAILTIAFALQILPIRITVKSIYQPILAALPIIPISLSFDCLIENNLNYVFIVVAACGIVYTTIMLFIFKNEYTCNIIYSIIKKQTVNH
jgi:O-antigen/teichoic acid export membrane protein